MDWHDLTPEQAAKMADAIRRQFRWLWRVTDRMRLREFPVDDELYAAARLARSTAGALLLKLGEVDQRASRETVGQRAKRLPREDAAKVRGGAFANWA